MQKWRRTECCSPPPKPFLRDSTDTLAPMAGPHLSGHGSAPLRMTGRGAGCGPASLRWTMDFWPVPGRLCRCRISAAFWLVEVAFPEGRVKQRCSSADHGGCRCAGVAVKSIGRIDDHHIQNARLHQRFQSKVGWSGFSTRRRNVIVLELFYDAPAVSLGHCPTVLQLPGNAQPFERQVLRDSCVDGGPRVRTLCLSMVLPYTSRLATGVV